METSSPSGSCVIGQGFLGGEFGHTWGGLVCWAETDDGPLCQVDFDLSATQGYIADHFVSQPFSLAPGNIGHERIEAESADGHVTLVGYRMDYD